MKHVVKVGSRTKATITAKMADVGLEVTFSNNEKGLISLTDIFKDFRDKPTDFFNLYQVLDVDIVKELPPIHPAKNRRDRVKTRPKYIVSAILDR